MRVWVLRIWFVFLLAWIASVLLGDRLPDLPEGAGVPFTIVFLVLSAYAMATVVWPNSRFLPPWDYGPRMVRWERGGAFTFDPRGANRDSATQAASRVSAVWWEPEPKERVAVNLDFRLSDVAPRDAVQKATAKGLAAATAALPGRGKVRARAALEDLPGPLSEVHVKLDVRGHGATKEWAQAAAEAFSRRFLRELERRDVDAAPA